MKTMTDTEQLAHRLCMLNRSHGGDRATDDLLAIAREFHPRFHLLPLSYPDGQEGPSAIIVGSHPQYANAIITAHYDTLGASGGCDNTSGVVALLLAAAKLPEDSNVCLALLPREEPPFYSSDLMGSKALRSALGEEPPLFMTIDTIGGRRDRGDRLLEVCGADHCLPQGWADEMVVGKRKLHNLSDARNFPENGVLLTDQRVLDVPMHTDRDTVDAVDWDFVQRAADKITELFS